MRHNLQAKWKNVVYIQEDSCKHWKKTFQTLNLFSVCFRFYIKRNLIIPMIFLSKWEKTANTRKEQHLNLVKRFLAATKSATKWWIKKWTIWCVCCASQLNNSKRFWSYFFFNVEWKMEILPTSILTRYFWVAGGGSRFGVFETISTQSNTNADIDESLTRAWICKSREKLHTNWDWRPNY